MRQCESVLLYVTNCQFPTHNIYTAILHWFSGHPWKRFSDFLLSLPWNYESSTPAYTQVTDTKVEKPVSLVIHGNAILSYTVCFWNLLEVAQSMRGCRLWEHESVATAAASCSIQDSRGAYRSSRDDRINVWPTNRVAFLQNSSWKVTDPPPAVVWKIIRTLLSIKENIQASFAQSSWPLIPWFPCVRSRTPCFSEISLKNIEMHRATSKSSAPP